MALPADTTDLLPASVPLSAARPDTPPLWVKTAGAPATEMTSVPHWRRGFCPAASPTALAPPATNTWRPRASRRRPEAQAPCCGTQPACTPALPLCWWQPPSPPPRTHPLPLWHPLACHPPRPLWRRQKHYLATQCWPALPQPPLVLSPTATLAGTANCNASPHRLPQHPTLGTGTCPPLRCPPAAALAEAAPTLPACPPCSAPVEDVTHFCFTAPTTSRYAS